MTILLKNVHIIDPRSEWHEKQADVLIADGQITQIAQAIETLAATVIDQPNLYLSAGWFDMRTHACEPGYEHKEDIATLSKVAVAGGFTEIALLPNTKPVVQTKESVLFFAQMAQKLPVQLHAMAAVTLQCEGKDFTEMLDLHQAGAVAFTDGNKPIWHADMLLKALQYLYPINALLITRPEDLHLNRYGQMHEGIMSTALGMKGMPTIAETMAIRRDIELLDYCQLSNERPRLHFSLLSSRQSVELIRQAKQQGLPVSCDVAAHYLALDDSALSEFDTNFKVNPPFRLPADVQALWEGLADGTIDAVVSDHHPHDEESKNLEFDLADFGVVGLETLFAVANTHNKTMSLSALIDKLTIQPRRILRQAIPRIAVGEVANLTLFDPQKQWTVTEKSLRSRAKNSPFLGQTLRGKAVAIIHKNQLTYAE
ncbi:MAG: dihydroorotase [Spirosomataceae bacterium]